MSLQTQEETRMTLEEFFQLAESMTLTEYIDGEVFMSPAPHENHQGILFSIGLLLVQYVRSKHEIRISPTDLLIDNHTVLQPDLFWVNPESDTCMAKEGRFYGAPDLVVEILFPSTATRDKTVKFDLYETNGVKEYWIVDPSNEYVDVFVRVDDKFDRPGKTFGKGDSFISPALGGKSIDVNAIFG